METVYATVSHPRELETAFPFWGGKHLPEFLLKLFFHLVKQDLRFDTLRFAFRYTSPTVPQRKLSARLVLGHFTGVDNDNYILRAYVPKHHDVIVVHRQDFRPIENSKFPGAEALIDVFPHQSMFDTEEQTDGTAEEGLHQALHSEPVTACCFIVCRS